MAEMIDETIDDMIDKKSIKDLVPLPGDIYNRLIERLRRRRFEAQGFRIDDTPAGQDTPEG